VHISFELDHDPFAETTEIHDEPVQHMLPPEFESENAAVPQQRPRVSLGRRRCVGSCFASA
jgi:hypothetical protein